MNERGGAVEGQESPPRGRRLLPFEGRPLTPQEANHLLELSFVFEVQERVDDAIALFSSILSQYPLWADVHFRLGGALEARGDLSGAEQAYLRAVGLNPRYVDARRKLGEVLIDQGCFEEALQHFDAILESRVEHRYADVHNNLGVIHEQRGDLEAAEACYREALKINPRYERGRYNLANVLDASGRSLEAQAEYRLVLERNPQDGRSLQNLAVSLALSGQLGEAAANLETLLELEPHNMLAWENLAAAYRDLGLAERAEEAEERARAMPALPPENLPFNLESVLREALDHYSGIVERKSPRWPDLYFKLGIVLEGLEESGRARECYEKALELNPNYLEAHRKLAELCFDQGDLDQALAEFEKVLEIRVAYRYADVHNNRGVACEGLGNHEAARQAYLRALEINPRYSRARYNLGNACMNLESYAEAVEQYRLVLEHTPEDTRALNNMGICLAQAGRNQEALEAFALRVGLEPENPDAHFNLAQLHEALEHVPEAGKHYRRALELDPGHEGAIARLKALVH